jgi:hypothetical protein
LEEEGSGEKGGKEGRTDKDLADGLGSEFAGFFPPAPGLGAAFFAAAGAASLFALL